MFRNLIQAMFLFILLAASAEAIPPTPLPAVKLMSENGASIMADKLALEGSWLLVLVKSGSGAGDTLLSFLADLDQPVPAEKLVIVISGADAKTFSSMKGRWMYLSKALWFNDSGGQLSGALGMQASPAVLGISDSTAMWSVVGLPDPYQIKQMMLKWIGQ